MISWTDPTNPTNQIAQKSDVVRRVVNPADPDPVIDHRQE